MLNEKRRTALEGSSYRYVKKNVPFSIKEIKHPSEIVAWRTAVALKSSYKREAARERAMQAFTEPGLTIRNGQIMTEFEVRRASYVEVHQIKNYSWSDLKAKPCSIWQHISTYVMNVFLNINFN